MNPFEMVVLIVAIVVIAKLVRDRAIGRDADTSNTSRQAADTARMIDEIARLRARVEVLERLATDRSSRLSDEIDRL